MLSKRLFEHAGRDYRLGARAGGAWESIHICGLCVRADVRPPFTLAYTQLFEHAGRDYRLDARADGAQNTYIYAAVSILADVRPSLTPT